MKQDDENEEEEAATVCQDFSDLFSRSLSLSSIDREPKPSSLDEREERERGGRE